MISCKSDGKYLLALHLRAYCEGSYFGKRGEKWKYSSTWSSLSPSELNVSCCSGCQEATSSGSHISGCNAVIGWGSALVMCWWKTDVTASGSQPGGGATSPPPTHCDASVSYRNKDSKRLDEHRRRVSLYICVFPCRAIWETQLLKARTHQDHFLRSKTIARDNSISASKTTSGKSVFCGYCGRKPKLNPNVSKPHCVALCVLQRKVNFVVCPHYRTLPFVSW